MRTYRYLESSYRKDVNPRSVDMAAFLHPSHKCKQTQSGDILPDYHEPQHSVIRLAVRHSIEVSGQVRDVHHLMH